MAQSSNVHLRSPGILFAGILLAACSPGGPASPDAPWLTAPDATTHDKRFPIASGPHATGCASCHANTDTFKVFDCLGCHTQAPTEALHGGEPQYQWASASCYACHPRGTGTLSAATHAVYFPIEPGKAHALGNPAVHASGTIGCTSCHTSPDHSQADCTACHTQASMTSPAGVPAHVSVPDVPAPFAPGPATSLGLCLKCHADGAIPVSVSTATARVPTHDARFAFEIAPGAVHDAARMSPPGKCATCHSVTFALQGGGPGASLTAIDFKQQTCTACHSTTGSLAENLDLLHASLGAVLVSGVPFTYTNLPPAPTAADSRQCLHCHPRGTVGSFDHTKWFPIARGDTHAEGRSFTVSGSATAVAVACRTCHLSPAAREQVTCTGCHTTTGTNATKPNPIDLIPAHTSQLGGTSWQAPTTPTRQCLLCHAMDQLDRVSTHGAGPTPLFTSEHPGTVFVIDATAPGHFAACETCHPTMVASGGDLKLPRIDFDVRTCNACHSEALDKLVTIHARLGVTPAVSDTVDAGNAAIPGHATQCMTCHADGRAAPPGVAFTHADFPVTAGSAHAMGTPGVHLPGTIACASCHSALAAEPARIDCTACHTAATLKNPAGAFAHAAVPDLVWPATPAPQATSLLCLRCHADSKVPASVGFSSVSNRGRHDATNANIVFAITGFGTHATANPARPMACFTCHPATTAADPLVPGFALSDFAQQDCTACHLQTGALQQDLAGLHKNVTTPAPGFTAIPAPITTAYSKTCLACHANGQIDPVIAAQNHAGFFPIGATDSHAYGKMVTVAGVPVATACSACHVDANNRQNVDCTGCHLQAGSGVQGPAVPADQTLAHKGKVGTTGQDGAPDNLWLGTGPVGNGAGASAGCVKCHGGDARPRGFVALHGKASAATGNAVFPIDDSLGHFFSCDQCHAATLTTASRKNPEFDFAQAKCTPCHADTGPASIVTEHAGIPYNGQPGVTIDPASYRAGNLDNAAACLTCHPNGGQALGFTHGFFPLTAADNTMPAGAVAFAHNTVAKCADCHTPGQPHSDLLSVTCRGCHNDTAPANQNGATLTARHSSPALGVTIWTVPGKWSAAPAGSTSTTDSRLCLQCHAGNNVSSKSASRLTMRLAGHDNGCSPSKSIGRSGSDHSVNRDGDNGAGSGVPACFVCHNAMVTTAGGKTWSRDWTVVTDGITLGCLGCHEHARETPSYRQCP